MNVCLESFNPGPTCSLGGPLRTRDFGPTREAVFHLCAVRRRGQQMPSRSAMVGDGSICRQKSLGMPGGFELLHAILALACGPLRVLAAVIEVATLAMLHPGQDLALRRAVALQLIRNDDPRYVL
jgi:hypothetical protein